MNFQPINQQIVKMFIRNFFIPLQITILLITIILFYYLDSIERAHQKEILQRLEKRLNQDRENLSNLLIEWTDYDSPVLYFNNKYPTFVKDEFVISVKNLRLNLFVSINKDNTLKEIYFFNEEGHYIQVPKDLYDFFKNQNVKHLIKREDKITGIIGFNNNQEFLFFSARGVLWFKENYQKSHGTLIFGRLINRDLLSIYANDIGYNIEIFPAKNNHLFEDKISIKWKNIMTNQGILIVNDFFNKPLFYFLIEFPKNQLLTSLFIIIIINLIILALGFISYIFIKKDIYKSIIKRLEEFNKEIQNIRKNPDRKEIQINNPIIDEITLIHQSFNELLNELKQREELNKKYLELVELEKDKTFQLLLNILPKKIAYQMSEADENNFIIADEFSNASILFADIVNFTSWSKNLDPKELVLYLNQLFSQIDFLTEKYNVEKIKTIGDCYMAATGIIEEDEYHADNIILFALNMLQILKEFNQNMNTIIQMRIGINSGKVVAGVIGAKKFIYDVWGDTVNLASRMESSGIENSLQISEYTYNCIKNSELKKQFVKRGLIKFKSGHIIPTYIYKEENKIIL
jgi:class 3 adenylate cyclase/sensor domain CHASE-containing protein